MVRGRKNPSTAPRPASSRATRSSAGQPARVDAAESESSATQKLPKLRIPGNSRLPTTPTTSTPTTTRAPSPSRSSPEITPPPEFNASNAEVRNALNSLMGPGLSNKAGVLQNEVTDSEESDSDEVEILDHDAEEQPWSPILQHESPSHRKDKRKRGASDVSRDQVSGEGSVGAGGIDEEAEEEEEEETEEEELKGTPVANDNPSLLCSLTDTLCFRY
jgi:hypothetical protein